MISKRRIIRGINIVLVVGSAVLTGIFGYTFGGDTFLLGVVFFAIFASLSLLSPMLWEYAAEQARAGAVRVAMITAAFGGIFFAYDVATNFGTAALFRESEMVVADNQNDNAKNARNEVKRIEKRMGEIRATAAWQGTYNSPQAYDDLIAAAQLIRDNEAKRGGCGRLCEQKTKELAELQAAKANALQREALKSELKTLEDELKTAKVQALETPTVASAAITHARNIGAFVTGSMEPDETTRFWSNNWLTFSAALACSLAGIVTSMMLGWMAGPRPYEPETEPQYAPNGWIPADHSRPGVTPAAPYSAPRGYYPPTAQHNAPQPLSVVVNESSDDERWQRVKQYLVSKGAMPA